LALNNNHSLTIANEGHHVRISNIPTDIKKCLKHNIDNINTEHFLPKDDFLDRLINKKSLIKKEQGKTT
jgi:hypothetical protein